MQDKADKGSLSKLADIIRSKDLCELACIPTKDCMKKPSSLYSPSITNYVKKTEDWENKIPLENIDVIKYEGDKTIFDLLPFRKGLCFTDCLYALLSVYSKKHRPTIVSWAIESCDENFSSKIDEYREDNAALWMNTKNEKVSIKTLYALEQGSKTLSQYFSGLSRILNPNYINITDYDKACEIFKIKIITDSDLIVYPQNKENREELQLQRRLMICALVLSALSDLKNWNETYCECNRLIEQMSLWRCTSISLQYKGDSEICQTLKKFYYKADTCEFFYVESLDAKRVFAEFVSAFVNYIDLSDNVDKDVISDVMDSTEGALNKVCESNELKLDEEFMSKLDELIPGIKRKMVGNKAEDSDAMDVEKRRTYTAHTTVDDNERDYDVDNEFNNDKIINEDDDIVDEDKLEDINDESSEEDTSSNKGVDRDRNPRNDSNYKPKGKAEGKPYSDMEGWNRTNREYTPRPPKPYSPEDVEKFKSHGISRALEVLEPTISEIEELNSIIGEDLSPEQIADHNYIAQLRLYNNLKKKGMNPEESREDFIRNAHLKNEHTLQGGRYIHKCSAAGGIMYISPSIWNKIADGNCVVCVYLGAKANDFMYFNSTEDILKWIDEDDIVIKLTGKEKAEVVEKLYSGVLNGVKGTAYTLIRINSNEKHNSLFAPVMVSINNNEVENEDEY